MKNKLLTFTWIWLAWLIAILPAIAQQLSTNQVNYQLTYNSATQTYTVWVVPQYATPNANNPNANEFGATAQVSLKVPKDFVIQNITDIKGTWDKNPVKLGNQSIFTPAGLDPNYLYYVIGKTSTEANYGAFSSGTPVSLFTFQSNACFGAVGILAKTDPFVAVAKNLASLNTAGSFYSRSGQSTSGNVIPLEQFVDKLGPDVDCSAPSIKLIKSIASITDNGPTGRGVGDVINYTFTVTNTGNVTLTGVTLTDAKLSLSNAAVSPATLAPGATGTATATYTITQTDVNAGGVENTATVTATPSSGPVSTVTDVSDAGTNNNAVAIANPDATESPRLNGTTDADPTNDPTVLLITPAPSIKLIKSIASITDNGPTGRGVGDVINYTFTVTNTGNVTLTGVALTDAKLSLSNAAVSPATLAPGATGTATATYTITQADVNAGGVENTATVTGTPPNLPNGNPATPVTDISDAGTNNNAVAIANPDATESPRLNGTTDADPTNDPTVLLITPAPSIKLIKSIASITDNGPTGRGVGDVINYTFTVTNTGNVTLTGVALTDAKLSLSNAAVSPATLAPGATGTATATYTITQADVNAGGVENTATVTGTPPNLPNGNPATPVTDVSDAGTDNNAVAIANPDATESPRLNGTTDADPTNDPTVLLITPAPSIKLIKSIASITDNGPTGRGVGDVINYTFTVTNTGNVTLTGVALTDAKLSLSNAAVSPATLAPGATGTATATYTITQADVNAGGIENTATVTGTPPNLPNGNPATPVTDISDAGTDNNAVAIANPDATESPRLNGTTDADPTNDPTVLLITPAPSIKLIKSIASITDNGPTGRGVGDVINYTFTVTNTGNVTLTGVALTDAKLSLSNAAVSPATLAPGATGTATATYTITQADVNAGGVENTATVTGTPPNLPNGNPATPVTDVSDAGTNNNAVAIANPDATESPRLNGTTDANPTNDPTVLLITPAPSIKLIKSIASITDNGPTGRGVGDVINYTFTVTNTGNVTLTGVALIDVKLSLNMSNAAVSPATLAPGATGTATATYTITQADVNAGGVENTATVTGTPPNLPNGNPATPVTDVSDAGTNNNAVAIANPDATESPRLNGTTDADPTNDPTVLLITPAPSIKLIKSIASITDNGPTGRGVGDVINYTFTVTNTGNVTLTGVALTDAKLSLSNAAVSPATLAPGATGTATATYTITQADVNAGGIENTATVTGTPPNLPNGNPATPVTDISDAGTNNNAVAIANPDATESPRLNGTTDADPTNDPTVLLITPAPSIKLIKSIASITDNGPTGRGVGDVINYTFTVTNTGNVTLTGVALTDAKLSLSNAAVSPATLAPGTTGTATATYTITQADVNAGGVENTATVTGTPPNLPNGNPATAVTDISDAGTDNNAVVIANPDATESPRLNGTTDANPTNDPTVLLITPAPQVRLVKLAALGGTGAVGDVITYTFTVTNTGNVTLTNLSVDDVKLSLTDLAVSPSTLAPNASGTATATYTITQADLNAGEVKNTATVTGTPPTGPDVTDVSDSGNELVDTPADPDSDPTNDPTVVPLTPAPQVRLVKLAALGGTGAVGDVITYTFTVTNTGNVTLTNLSVDDVKLSLTDLAVSPSTLAPNASGTATATYTITQADLNAGEVKNTATVTGTPPTGPDVTDVSDSGNELVDTPADPDSDPTNDPTVVPLTPAPQVRLVKLAALGGTGAVGDVITYTFTVTNTGNVTLTNLSVDDVKLSLTDLAVSPSTLAPNASGTATATYTITQADLNAGEVKNTATVTGTPPTGPDVTDVSDSGNELVDTPADPDSDPTNDPTVVPLTPAPQVRLVKLAALGGTGAVGDVITYTFTVTNTGNVTLTNLSVDDVKLSLTDLAVSPSTLAPNASGTATATYTITQADLNAGEVKNTATVTGTPPTGPDVTDVSDSGNELVDTPADPDSDPTNDPTVVPLTPAPQVRLVKLAALGGTGAVGDVITYTFTVTNTGNVTLTNLSVDDVKLSLTDLAVTPSTLAPNASGTATATYTITQADLNAGEVKNTATVTGTPPTGPDVTDVSDSGNELVDTPADPDSDPTNDPTVVPLTQGPKIGIAKEVSSFVDNLNYTYDITFSLKVKNAGNVPLSNVQVFDTLSKTFPSPATVNVLGISSAKFTVNPTYTGTTSQTQLLLPGNALAIGDSGSISLTVRVTPNVFVGGTYINIAYTTGQSPLGETVKDQSQLGNNPDPDFDGDPQNNFVPTPITIQTPGKLTLLPKVYLQGSLFGVFSGNLMRDDLRVKNLIPRKSPYVAWNPITPADTITSNTVLTVAGQDAIVDWVFVELRDANDSTVVVNSRSALVQRDGDIVEVDGTSPITFNTVVAANYFVSVRHRNHLGVMSQTALPLTQVVSTIDFRSAATPTYVLANSPIHQSQVDVVQGKALWAGNALVDDQVIYQGTDNDVNVIYQQVIAATGNPFLLPFYILSGYYKGDVNMDGEVVFQGTANDVEYIYQNVINNHPGNALKQNFFIIQEQLPK
ncbi:DUF7507 domain-containing protein [Runella sp.]|uniref:DUF7507 domain-containing protein n=1 Tax=Runella sp. TaxID=1960881 RepID=UPI003D10C85E